MEMTAPDEREVRYKISHAKDLPPLPRSLQRLLEIIHDEVGSIKELESIVGYDQCLAAKILAIANSAYYGLRGEVRSLSRAMMVIGFEQVKSVCLCTLLMEAFASKGTLEEGERERLWKHAFATARISADMAGRRPWVKKEEAYALGLLHDIGRVWMAVNFPDRYETICRLSRERKAPPWCVEMQVGLSHTLLGKWLATRWALPMLFQEVMEYHHSPEKGGIDKAAVKLIHLANTLAHSREYPEFLSDEATLAVCGELFVTEEEWEGYQQGLDRIWGEVDQLWSLLR